MTNKYITVAYKLYVPMQDKEEMVEEATVAHPFQFISGMGLTLDVFEKNIEALSEGDSFDFTLSADEAYGPYMEEGVQALEREMFEENGKLDEKIFYVGSVIPLMNEEGQRFNGTIVAIDDQNVTVDLNHPFAGKTLHFVGSVVTHRDATNEEMQEMINRLSPEGHHGCGGCGGHCGGCSGDCCDGCND